MNRMADTIKHIKTLKKFMAPSQISVIGSAVRGEEGAYFHDKIAEMANTFNTMPKTYEQDGKGDQAVAHLHYFRGGMDWFITEKDMEAEQIQAFGYCDLGMGCPELGYVSLVELAENNIELDLHWTPKTLKEIKESRK